jgi:hypothetical protein
MKEHVVGLLGNEHTLKNERQEWKTGPFRKWVRVGVASDGESEYGWCTSYTYMKRIMKPVEIVLSEG